MRAQDGWPLLGRRQECRRLDQVLTEVRAGGSAALVLTGEAGVGKSALLDGLLERATDCRVIRATGVETEMELVFAGLHQVCAPFLDRLADLPDPQADALRVAFGLAAGDVPERFLIGLATMTLLSEAARETALVCVVDDAQWLDQASLQILAFVARRLVADSVALVFARRDTGTVAALDGLPELVVRGLDDEHSRALLRSVVAGLLDEPVRDRIVAETRGNPLALVELTHGLRAQDLTAGVGPTRGRALPSRVEAAFQTRIAGLPEDVRRLLLVAAAEPTGDPVLLWRAATLLGIVGVDPEASNGLLTVRERVTFRHPLARSAAYRSAPAEARCAVHAALAEATDRTTDPDRWAWHLAAAAAGPDERVAAELEHGAGRARARGGVAAAAAFLRRSVTVTPDPARRAGRALRAAEASLEAGEFDTTHDLLVLAGAGPLDEAQRAHAELLSADAAYTRSRGGDGPTLMLGAARSLERLDPVLARKTYLDAWSAALFAGPLAAPGGGLIEVSRAALAAPPTSGPARPFEVLLEGLARAMTRGRRDAAPILRRAAAAFLSEEVTEEEVLRFGWLAAAAASMVWDLDRCVALASLATTRSRRAGALNVLAVELNVLTQQTCLTGDLDTAAGLVDEAAAVTEAIGGRVAPFGAIIYHGMRGRESEALPWLEDLGRRAHESGQGVTLQHTRWSTAVLHNGLGRPDRAFAPALAATQDTPELFVATRAAPELLEAAVATGERDVAEQTLGYVLDATAAAGTVLADGVAARCRAMLAGDGAGVLFEEALGLLAQTRARPELARAHLSHGEWLLERGRGSQAREQLRRAHTLFADCRMQAFEERARRALARTGLRVRGARAANVLESLTAQEAEIARLVGNGLSNPEIGATLFVSPRTVEWHLHKVFVKLGVSSRGELVAELNAAASPAPARGHGAG